MREGEMRIGFSLSLPRVLIYQALLHGKLSYVSFIKLLGREKKSVSF